MLGLWSQPELLRNLNKNIKAMTPAEILLAKLDAEANLRFERKWIAGQKRIVERNVRKPETVTKACRRKVSDLTLKSEAIYEELYQRKLLEIAEEQNTKANSALIKANMTPAERAAKDEEIRQGQILFSRVVGEENHPGWRSQPNFNLEFYQRQAGPPKSK
jgi:hypothetical protein